MVSFYVRIPAFAIVVGAAITLWFTPGPLFRSSFRHLVAGVVFATAAAELLPDILHEASMLTTLVGGTAGGLVMLAIRKLEDLVKGPLGTLTAIGVDILVNGLPYGVWPCAFEASSWPRFQQAGSLVKRY